MATKPNTAIYATPERTEAVPDVPAVPSKRKRGERNAPGEYSWNNWIPDSGGNSQGWWETPSRVPGTGAASRFRDDLVARHNPFGKRLPRELPMREESERSHEVRNEGRELHHQPRAANGRWVNLDHREDHREGGGCSCCPIVIRDGPEGESGSHPMGGSNSEEPIFIDEEEAYADIHPGQILVGPTLDWVNPYPFTLWTDEHSENIPGESSPSGCSSDETFGSSPIL